MQCIARLSLPHSVCALQTYLWLAEGQQQAFDIPEPLQCQGAVRLRISAAKADKGGLLHQAARQAGTMAFLWWFEGMPGPLVALLAV